MTSGATMNDVMLILQAGLMEELRRNMSGIDVTVPAWDRRNNPEGKKAKEIYCALHLLASLPQSDMSFPLSLFKRESPDFLLKMNGIATGIEVTDAISPDRASDMACRAREKTSPDVYHANIPVPVNMQPSHEQRRKNIEENTAGRPWRGDEMEVHWATVMSRAIKSKVELCQKPHFQRFANNWLLIYDNEGCVGNNLSKAVYKLKAECFLTFTKILTGYL